MTTEQPQKRSRPQPGSNEQRTLAEASIRALGKDEGGNDRQFRLSFSSEEPYQRWYGLEILDHGNGAVDLTRINEIGVVLFNHNRDYVVGKILKAWVEDNRGYADIEFDTDEDADIVCQKVKSGTLKGVSVGYRIEVFEEVVAGKQSVDGRFTGPCSIARKWWPFEISIVSVPADGTVGVGRQAELNDRTIPLDVFEAQLQINQNGGITA